jgi:hypothetical protein
MSRQDPTDRSLLRMELRRFQARCESQTGSLRRADTIRAVVKLALIPIPFPLSEDDGALTARAQLRRDAEERARELINEQMDQLLKCDPLIRDKVRRGIDDALQQLTGPLSALRVWAQGRLLATEQQLGKPT